MMTDLAQQAVQAALKGEWEKARELNLCLLDADPENVDALNRLARAHAELGEFTKAKKIAEQSLKCDPFNQIAKNALEKWKDLKNGSKTVRQKSSSPQVFLEEPGKTKVVKLMNLGAKDVIAQIDAGDEVVLSTHAHLISVCTDDGAYIGKLTDLLSSHLRNLIKHGNEYACYVKSSNPSEVKVIIRETKRSAELKDIPSFTGEKVDHITLPEDVD